MGELLDRGFQHHILQEMANDYPAASRIKATFGEQSDNMLKVNLAYLHEHGLIACNWHPTLDDPYPLPTSGTITAAGLDFLADDGGLSSILGVVTIRFDDETLRALLLEKIQNGDGDPDMKSQMIAAVKAMPAEAIKAVGEKAISYGISAAPAGLLAFKSFIGL
ncbi:hypothetical protein [Shimia sediminis]|uniref:hypothetical protein n=1 Tax=Shimia sediminis TaxID=2497945 RepID=UPI000F8E4567|nr:hypothetical protein [Shimia sediminis]